jgi:hypothetical protein
MGFKDCTVYHGIFNQVECPCDEEAFVVSIRTGTGNGTRTLEYNLNHACRPAMLKHS